MHGDCVEAYMESLVTHAWGFHGWKIGVPIAPIGVASFCKAKDIADSGRSVVKRRDVLLLK